MAKEKKSHKADKKRNSNSAAAYVASFRRYFNKIRAVKKHVKRQGDGKAKMWLQGATAILAMEYVRGSEVVRKLHEAHFGA